MALRLEHILYSIGGLFAAAAIIYFAWEYLISLPRIVKTLLLILLIFLFFFLGKELQRGDR